MRHLSIKQDILTPFHSELSEKDRLACSLLLAGDGGFDIMRKAILTAGVFSVFLLLLSVTPASASHRHYRGCGHSGYYSNTRSGYHSGSYYNRYYNYQSVPYYSGYYRSYRPVYQPVYRYPSYWHNHYYGGQSYRCNYSGGHHYYNPYSYRSRANVHVGISIFR